MSDEWNNYDNSNKTEKGNKVKNKEGSTSQRKILMETTKPGKKSKKEAGDLEWYRERKGLQGQAVE